MLPPFIIEQIRKREEEEAVKEGPRLELPLPDRLPIEQKSDEEPERGVVIIDLMG
ncbi:MAG: hypothetical protein KC416_13315 [Myxococcales bacterium]|nr:hypothetical protein [Myxococcales bacterium]